MIDPSGFIPAPALRNRHAMTILPKFWPRGNVLASVPTERRVFQVTPETGILGYCHWQADHLRVPTILLLHGLEGSSESHYMTALAAKGWRAGVNVIRLNQRTCGGSEALTPGLYNSGLSQDFRRVIEILTEEDRLNRLWFVGYSMGGNLALKMAGEARASLRALLGVIAVCPNIDPTQCVAALEEPQNRLYHDYFLNRLKARVRRKAAMDSGKWNLDSMEEIDTIRTFDDVYTAPDGGYRDVTDYYDRSGARHVLSDVLVPTVILTAQDDPFIPFSMFSVPAITGNPLITVSATRFGGHCGFFQRSRPGEDRFWAENRIIELISADTRRL
ncbi:MAG: alpha/beta fold hydrolase [Nitrospiraceae bacterium]